MFHPIRIICIIYPMFLFGASLSPSNPSGYTYTIIDHPSLISGTGMGNPKSYNVVRYEDKAFISEALREIAYKTRVLFYPLSYNITNTIDYFTINPIHIVPQRISSWELGDIDRYVNYGPNARPSGYTYIDDRVKDQINWPSSDTKYASQLDIVNDLLRTTQNDRYLVYSIPTNINPNTYVMIATNISELYKNIENAHKLYGFFPISYIGPTNYIEGGTSNYVQIRYEFEKYAQVGAGGTNFEYIISGPTESTNSIQLSSTAGSYTIPIDTYSGSISKELDSLYYYIEGDTNETGEANYHFVVSDLCTTKEETYNKFPNLIFGTPLFSCNESYDDNNIPSSNDMISEYKRILCLRSNYNEYSLESYIDEYGYVSRRYSNTNYTYYVYIEDNGNIVSPYIGIIGNTKILINEFDIGSIYKNLITSSIDVPVPIAPPQNEYHSSENTVNSKSINHSLEFINAIILIKPRYNTLWDGK